MFYLGKFGMYVKFDKYFVRFMVFEKLFIFFWFGKIEILRFGNFNIWFVKYFKLKILKILYFKYWKFRIWIFEIFLF